MYNFQLSLKEVVWTYQVKQDSQAPQVFTIVHPWKAKVCEILDTQVVLRVEGEGEYTVELASVYKTQSEVYKAYGAALRNTISTIECLAAGAESLAEVLEYVENTS